MIEVSTTEFIVNTGFPIAACIYLLWERDRRVKEMTDIMGKMNNYLIILFGDKNESIKI